MKNIARPITTMRGNLLAARRDLEKATDFERAREERRKTVPVRTITAAEFLSGSTFQAVRVPRRLASRHTSLPKTPSQP
jgi:hypothetical protein